MIPAGPESATRSDVDRDERRSTLSLLLEAVRQVVATAEADLRPDQKLELLSVQIGTLQFFAEQLDGSGAAPTGVPAPHFDRLGRNGDARD